MVSSKHSYKTFLLCQVKLQYRVIYIDMWYDTFVVERPILKIMRGRVSMRAVLPGDDRLVTTWLNQEAGTVGHTAGRRVILKVADNPPR